MGRDPLDRYYTPPHVALACVQKLAARIPPPRTVLEPATGLGAYADAARVVWSAAQVFEMDLDPEAAAARGCLCGDFLAQRDTPDAFDLVIGNPPFEHAEAFIDHALSLAPSVAFLMPIAFLSGQKRAPKWREAWPLRVVWVLSKRVAFDGPATNGKNTSSQDYGFYLFDRSHVGPPMLD